MMQNTSRDDSDESFEIMRSIDLEFDEFSLPRLFEKFFFGEQRTDVWRKYMYRETMVNAWCVKLLLPDYTPGESVADGNRNDRQNSCDTRTPEAISTTWMEMARLYSIILSRWRSTRNSFDTRWHR